MDIYEKIEALYAQKFNSNTTSKKALGDFQLSEDHAVNVKSNNVDKDNYSPNLISASRLLKYLSIPTNHLSFIFVDYQIDNTDGQDFKILKDSGLVPVEHIDWSCLSIQAQGNGVIQLSKALTINPEQTRAQFMEGLKLAYQVFIDKERLKLARLEQDLKK